MADHGAFPFGRPNTVRPMRTATSRASATVVGVYPSAWHVNWRAPAYVTGDGRRGAVAALAVDVEPTVFWNGAGADFTQRLEQWRGETGFIEGDRPGCHGHVLPTSPSTNGSSGAKVEACYLSPIGVCADRAAFADVYPVFMVKRRASPVAKAGGEQGDAIRREYDAIAGDMGCSACTLPRRIPAGQLPRRSAEDFGDRIVSDLEAAEADLVITLGDEVLQTLRLLPQLSPAPPADSLTHLYGDRYGESGSLRVNGRTVRWLPLVHPGLLRRVADPEAPVPGGARTQLGWNILHARWAARSGC